MAKTRRAVLVEMKDPQPVGERLLLGLIARHGLRRHVSVQSFDHFALRRLRRLDGALALGALYPPGLSCEQVRTDLARVAAFATSVAPCADSVDAALVLAAHSRGLTLRAYTVNAGEEMRRLAGLGVDGIITDAPDRLREVVDRIGAAEAA